MTGLPANPDAARRVVMGLLSAALLSASLSAMPAAQQGEVAAPVRSAPQDVFRSGVDLVQLDVSALDKDGRPVRGLTVEDFTVTENGTPQSIVTFSPIDVPPPARTPAAGMRDVDDAVVPGDRDTRRLVVIVMNDGGTEFRRGESVSARKIARAVIDQLGPADRAAVLFTDRGKAQDFTTDRSKLLQAVDSFVPRYSPAAGPPPGCILRACVVDTLKEIARHLRTAAAGRKLIVLIGSTVHLHVDPQPAARMTPLLEMFSAMQAANVTINAFDPAGLRTYAPLAEHRSGSDGIGRSLGDRRSVDALRALAENTGGKTVVDTNTPEALVPEIFQQNSHYYLLGFRSSDPTPDGRYRRIQVKVNRPGVTVRTRSGYFAPR